MRANQAECPIATMARVLGVSPSGDGVERQRECSAREALDQALRARIEAIHERSRGTDGAPRIHAGAGRFRHAGERAERVARLMREAGLTAVSRRKGLRTTCRDPEARPALGLVECRFEAEAPDRLWVADITDVPTAAEFLSLAVVLDVFSRRVVGGRWPSTCAPSRSSMR